jgi:ECF transporter S component (folate family)
MFKGKNSKEKIKKISLIAMLVAITVILGYISGFLRIGNITKISVSFISVYIAAIFIGPVAGGFVGAVADFISYIVNPTGAYLWQLTLLEFVYGFLFGIVFELFRHKQP